MNLLNKNVKYSLNISTLLMSNIKTENAHLILILNRFVYVFILLGYCYLLHYHFQIFNIYVWNFLKIQLSIHYKYTHVINMLLKCSYLVHVFIY